MLKLTPSLTVCDGRRIVWNGLGMKPEEVLEISKLVLESNVPIKTTFLCTPVDTILGKMAVFSNEFTPTEILTGYLNSQFEKLRRYNPTVERAVEVLSRSWRPGKRVFGLEIPNFEQRMSVRKEMAGIVDGIFYFDEMDIGIAPASLRKGVLEIEGGKLVFSDSEQDLHEAVRKVFMLAKYTREDGVFFYEDLPVLKGKLQIALHLPKTIRMYLLLGDLDEVERRTRIEKSKVFEEILTFEEKYLVSVRKPIEAMLLLGEETWQA